MGAGRSKIAYGLYYNQELVSVMSFSKNNPSRKFINNDDIWELDRFATKLNTTISGAAQKIYSHFIKKHDPKKVISYSDNRWNSGKVYELMGFEKENDGTPNYWYFRPNDSVRYHRYTLRKNANDDQSLTEYENRLQQGYLRIWDCGSSKWVWTKK